jgi:hypothetical protein
MNQPFVSLRWEHDRGRLTGLGNDNRPIGSPHLFEQDPWSFL